MVSFAGPYLDAPSNDEGTHDDDQDYRDTEAHRAGTERGIACSTSGYSSQIYINNEQPEKNNIYKGGNGACHYEYAITAIGWQDIFEFDFAFFCVFPNSSKV